MANAGGHLSISSPAVAERPHDASCLSVVSFDSTIRQAQSSIISRTFASDLPLRKLSSVLFFSVWCIH